MADQQEPDEFGALPGGVSNLRSRFEQMSKSESSRPTNSKSLKATHTFGQPQKGLVLGQSGGKTQVNKQGGSSTLPSKGKSSTSGPSQPSDPIPVALASASAHQIASGAAAKPTLQVLSTSSSANSSTADLPKHVEAKAKPANSKRSTDQKSPNMPASKFGEPGPALRSSKEQQESASGSASASASDSEGFLVKVPPPRPPKPSAHGIHILDQADLERLAHGSSPPRVSLLTSMFNSHKGHPTSSLGNTISPGRLNTSQHFLKHSRSNEQLSPTSSMDTGAIPFRQSPPLVPPRPAKDLEPKSLGSAELDAETRDPIVISSLLASNPPPLPSRGVDYQTEMRRRSLSASRSTGSLPVFSAFVSAEGTDTPPLPIRGTPTENISPIPSPGSSFPLPPPPQRTAPAASSVHRANTIAAKGKPHLPRVPAHSRTMLPEEFDHGIQPPPTRATPSPSLNFARSSHTSKRRQSDSSDDDDEGDVPSALAHSLLKTPLGLRRPHTAAELMSSGGLPDTSHANRRAPVFSPDCSTSSKQAFQCFAVCGLTIVTGSGDKVKVYRVGESATGMGEKLCTVGEHLSKEVKLTALEFRPPNHGISPAPSLGRRSHGETADEGRYLWCGTKDGHIWELDVTEAQVIYSRQNVHTAAIHLLKRVGTKMLSLDESGKISIWLPAADPDPAIAGLRLSNQPITQRIAFEKGSYACVLGQQLWVATGPSAQRNAKDYAGSKGPRVRIYNPFADDKPFNATSKAVSIPADMAEGVGVVTGGTLIPSRPDRVYFGHDSGHVSIWSRQTYECLSVRKLGPHGLTAVAGVIKYLWAATRAGTIAVFDTESTPWQALKIWTAHKEPITAIKVDEHGIEKVGRLQVASGGLDASVHLWDGTLSFDWLQFEESKREAEFCTYRSIKTLNVTFNVDAASPADLETSAENMDVFPSMLRNACQVGSEAVAADRPPDIIVFGFQELIDLESKKLTAKSLLLGGGKKKANDLGDRVSRQYRAWYDKLIQIVRFAMPPTCGYLLVQSESLVGLFTCVFVKQSEFRNVRELAISTVKTGMGGRYGNKGAVIARMVMQDTSLVFVNCHLAAGQKQVKQRNADVADILEYATVFNDAHADPAAYVGGGDGSMILDHEACFWSGDLNYRIDMSRDAVLTTLYSKKFTPLLEQDQLRKELKLNAAFRLKAFSEAAITFLPTYKYDRGAHEWDTSEKTRVPAWCDRILFKTHHPDRTKCLDYRRWETTISDHRPVSALFEVKIKAADHAKRGNVHDQLKVRWKDLEKGILANAVHFYSDPH